MKDSVSRNEFGKWLVSYSEFTYGCKPLSGRDMIGRWIEFVTKSHYEKQEKLKI
jgi:hypothetical protein